MAGTDDDTSPGRICSGDVLAVSIASHDARKAPLPTTVQVADDGTVELPATGTLSLGGLTMESARLRVATAVISNGLESQPSVDLTITKRGTCHVEVAGAVAKPGPVELSNGSVDLASVLRAAGGLSDTAGTKIEIVHRNDRTVAVAKARPSDAHDTSNGNIKLASLTEDAKPDAVNPPEKTTVDLRQLGTQATDSSLLQNGDVVTVVAQESRTFRVEGLAKPEDIALKATKDTHVLDAIEMAGAKPAQLADLVFIIRQLPKMDEPIIISISLARAKHDDDENLRIAEGDIVLIRRTMSNMMGGAFSSMFHASKSP